MPKRRPKIKKNPQPLPKTVLLQCSICKRMHTPEYVINDRCWWCAHGITLSDRRAP